MRFVLALGLAMCLAVIPAQAQTWVSKESGTAAIRGRVVAAGGEPLSRAEVRLSGNGAGYYGVLTLLADAEGRYAFTELPPGRYALSAGRSGYLKLKYGQRRPADTSRRIELANGESRDQVDFELPRASVLEVTVTDEFGEPREGVYVQAQSSRLVNGRVELVTPRPGDVAQRNPVTDDRGQVRLYDLPQGDYYLTATHRGLGPAPIDVRRETKGPRRVYRPTFYPGTTSLSEAQPVTLALGQELSVSLAIAPAPVSRVSGTVVRGDGSPQTKGYVVLSPVADGRRLQSAASALLSAGGFEFADVAPGDYLIESRPGSDLAQSDQYGAMPVTVSGDDISGVVVTTARAATLRGRVVIEGESAAGTWKPDGFSLRLLTSNGDVHIIVADDRTFTRAGVTGTAFGWAGAGSGWFLKRVMHNGRDIADSALELSPGLELADLSVVVTRKSSGISGTARDEQGRRVSGYTAVIFAEDPARWMEGGRFVATVRADRSGRFTIGGLPPGRYRAAALDDLDEGQRPDTALLGRLKDVAAPVTLRDGESQSLTLTLVSF